MKSITYISGTSQLFTMKHALKWFLVIGFCLMVIPCALAETGASNASVSSPKLTSFVAPFEPIAAPNAEFNVTKASAEFEAIAQPNVEIVVPKAKAEFEAIAQPNVEIVVPKVKAEFEPIPAIVVDPLYFLDI